MSRGKPSNRAADDTTVPGLVDEPPEILDSWNGRSPAVKSLVVKQLVWLALAAAIIAVAAISEVRSADTSNVVLAGLDIPLPFRCLFRSMTGVPCPGCGVTRCVVSLTHARVASAWNYNPGGFVFFAAVVAQFPYRVWQLCRLQRGRKPIECPRLVSWFVTVLVAALLLQWAVRLGTGSIFASLG